MKINTFGVLSEIIDISLFSLCKDTDTMHKKLTKVYPKLNSVVSFTIIVNNEKVNVNTKLTKNDIVKLLPLFEGG